MKSIEDDGYRFRDIVVAVVTSDLFAHPLKPYETFNFSWRVIECHTPGLCCASL